MTGNCFIEAGTGGLGIQIEGPSEAIVKCKDNYDGSCSVEYVPSEPGDYDVSIRFADEHIPGSPFKVPADIQVKIQLLSMNFCSIFISDILYLIIIL